MCIPPAPDKSPSPTREINEAILAAIWNEQAPLRGPMWDCNGQPVAVVYRGRWTAGSGPDFNGAMLALGEAGGKLVNGDVEMHLRCSDWYAHGHDTDPRYNSVTLHVVLWPVAAKPVQRADGKSIPTLVLADYITMPTTELLERVSPMLPNLGTLSEEPCWQRTEHWPLEKLYEHVDAAGDARLNAKAAQMEADLGVYGSLDDVFYRGIMDALGYSANREPMRALAAALPLDQLLLLPLSRDEGERALLLEAVLLGAGGLLQSQRPDLTANDWLSSDYSEEIEELWSNNAPILGINPARPITQEWAVDRVRPANSPPRRLAAGARLLAKYLWTRDGMLGLFQERAADLAPAELAKEWTGMFQVPGDGYWANHSDFGRSMGGATTEDFALIGQSRAADMVVNILLPLLLAHADLRGSAGLHEKVEAVYAVYPKLADNKITRAMSDEVFGPRRRGAIRGARRQQGLIHLYRLYCEARRCYECPVSGLRNREPQTPNYKA
ncbi:MAG: DUF2851 family protein [Chloroflexota bacterium]